MRALLALVVLAVAAAPASASTLSGKVSGTKLPKPGKGITTVRAVDARTLVIADVAKVRSHRYSLKVPAGRYWMFAATTPFRGRPGVERSVGKVAIRKGKKKKVPVSLRKRRRARASYAIVKYPAVWVKHFAAPGEYSSLRKGLADMLITDVSSPLASACGGVIVEREKLALILAENTSPEKIIAHNREVSGALTVTGETATLTVDVTNVVSGATRSVTRSAAADRIFELESSVVQDIVRLLCDKPPRHYAGPASGSIVASDGSSSETLSWNGNVRLKFTGDLVDGDPPGEYGRYQPESGTIHVILDGVNAECTYHQTADVTIVPPPLGGQDSFIQQGVETPFYKLDAQFPEDTPPMLVTVAGPAYCDGGTTYPYGLAGRVFMTTLTNALPSSSSTLTGETSRVLGNVTFKWAWSLGPEA